MILKATIFSLLFLVAVTHGKPPNIVIIIADDLGWNDVSFHGSKQIPTPNIDALAYSGVIMNNYYVQPICTPSRSALLTGRHPIHTGMQHSVIVAAQPYGLPLSETLLPQLLQPLGYSRRHVGKWHLGFHKADYTPTRRGFESHFGYWSGRIDYYDHTACDTVNQWGYDMRNNLSVAWDAYGKYSTDLFTNEAVNIIGNHATDAPLFLYLAHLAVHSANDYTPLQPPPDVGSRFDYIKDPQRRRFAGMLWRLDESVGEVVKALDKKGILNNTIIVFSTDNGGPAAGFDVNAASNWPLRGVKASLWEGGIRGSSFIWSPQIKNPGRVNNEIFHITDWLPTLYRAAGGDPSTLKNLDGVDQWKVLTDGLASPRDVMLLNIDPISHISGIRINNWKLVSHPQGYGAKWDGWFGPSGRNDSLYTIRQMNNFISKSSAGLAVTRISEDMQKALFRWRATQRSAEVLCGPIPSNATKNCDDQKRPCLFDISEDPCEYHDLSDKHPDLVATLQQKLSTYRATAVTPGNQPIDPAAEPRFWDYTWTHWKDFPTPPALF